MPHTDNMPTFGRLVAAVILGAVGWWVSDLIRPLMDEGTDFGLFNYINAGLGLLAGWVVVGKRLGRGYSNGLSAGLTGLGALVIWGLLAHGLIEMLKMALDRRYDGFMKAMNGLMGIITDYALVLMNTQVIGALLVGGVVTGLIGEWVARRWS